MSFYAVSALVNFITSSALGVFVISKGKNNKNLGFFIFCFFVAFWSLSYFLWQISNTSQEALFWSRVLMAGAIFIPVAYLHFSYALVEMLDRRKNFLIFSYFLFSLFLLADLTPYFISHVEPVLNFPAWPIAGPLYSLFLFVWFCYVIYSTYLLYQKYRVSSGLIRLQIRYVIFGMVVGFAGGSTNYFLWYGIPIPPVANILVSVYVGSIAYAIIQYRLMDIRVVARRVLVYFCASLVAYAVFYSIVWIDTTFLGGVHTPKAYLAGIVFALIFVPFFQKVSKLIEQSANKYLFFTLYNYQETINKISSQLTYHTDLKKISELIVSTIKTTMGVKEVAVTFLERGSRREVLHKYLESTQRPVVFEELSLLLDSQSFVAERETLSAVLEKLKTDKVSVCLPLVSNRRLIGTIALGPKIIGDPFTLEDLELLSVLANQASIAIDNAQLYKEVKDFNKTLKQKVDEQTKDLREQADHLKKLLAMRSEFLDIASHQLKTPISVITGTISMFKEGSIQKLPKEEQDKFIDHIYIKTQKLSQIIADILQASEIDSDELTLVQQRVVPTDLAVFLTNLINEFKFEAEAKKLKLELVKIKENISPIKADPEFLKQALSNLIDNAIKYTKAGGVTITLDEDVKRVMIKVKDTGVGIPSADQSRMFGKFERATNARNMYTDGTGLGLFITKEIIEAHPGGAISFTSREGEGTEFLLSFNPYKETTVSYEQKSLVN